ncbi:MAG: response regulator [Candidatus Buchananbacteria bacterium]|jgi:DNA-binding response OmpR family regulator
MAEKIKKILIAEDEKPLSNALQLKLTKAGFKTEAAFNGQEALAMLNQQDFDFLILDLVMPKINGFEVLTEIKKSGKKIKIIVLSNLAQAEDQKRVKDLGAQDYFVKSNTPIGDIVKKIKESV